MIWWKAWKRICLKYIREAETDEQKAEIVINAMKELALHGTAILRQAQM